MLICKECNREFETLDSLRRHRVQKHKISAEQTYIDYKLDGRPPLCKCGCGSRTNFLSIEKGFVEYILGHASRVHNNWGHNQEAIKKSHETQKEMYKNGELIIWNKGLTIDDKRVSDNIQKVMSNPNRGENISKALSGVVKSEEHKLNISKTAVVRWSDESEREKQSHRRMEYIIREGFQVKSKLEETFKNILMNSVGLKEEIDFYHQFYVREIKAIYDFKISGKKILIEVDGDYWHCNPNGKFPEPIYKAQKANLVQDKIKEQWCVDNGYNLLRFWEKDINERPEWIIEQLRIDIFS